MPLRLEFKVLNNLSCQPASGCSIDIWQCGVDGLYSGVDNIVFDDSFKLIDEPIDMKDETFLRGHQITDENGIAVFETIYPGWYFPRLTHIHARTMVPGVDWTALDTQLYFPQDVEREVFRSKHYAKRGPNPISPRKDGLIKGDLQTMDKLTVDLRQEGEGLVGTALISLSIL